MKTRFAPSPTGYLHIGGARTALYAWLLARHAGGTFVLRIEDTDTERSTAAYTDSIIEAMQWLGLDCDEGPYHQTERMDRYQAVLAALEKKGMAYRCTCSKARLEGLRAEQMKQQQKPRYDGHCRDKDHADLKDGAYVLRFRTPHDGVVCFDDAVRGKISVANEELDDLVLARSDGSPTYNLTVVVDDADMGISHVLRGDDHINNTPRQIHIYQAMGWDIPVFCHVPMILGADGKRLSKRHGALSVLAYRDEGYLPQALLNYLVRLGWSHGDQEIFDMDSMVAHFDLAHLSHSPGMFSVDKLQWLNQHYLKASEPATLVPLLSEHLAKLGVTDTAQPPLADVVVLLQERAKTMQDMAQMALFWYCDELAYDPACVDKHLGVYQRPILQSLMQRFAALKPWTKEGVHGVVKQVVAETGLKFPKVAQPLRVALTGGVVSPAIDATVYLLGQARAQQRLEAAVTMIEGVS